MTVAERMLWSELRNLSQNWRRQAPIGPFVVDFVRHRDRLVVELDGYYHRDPERQARDAERTAYLNNAGFWVVRFDEADVRNRLEQVVAALEPFPLEGGRAGLGVRAEWGGEELPRAAPGTLEGRLEAQPFGARTDTSERAPPSPTLPASRGKGA